VIRWVLALVACQPAGPGPGSGLASEPIASPTGSSASTPTAPTSPAPLAVRTRFARLSHAQWSNAVSDLLGVPGDWSAGFLDDPVSTFSTDAAVLELTPELHGDQQRAAEAAVAALVADPVALAAFEGSVEVWLGPLLRRAFRRPPTPDELAAYTNLADQASALLGDAPEDVVALVVQAVLQSPHFGYRVEWSEGAGAVPLDDWELAARLAFSLWNTLPDDALLDAAEAGRLTDPATLPAEVDRMLADPRARDVLRGFHAELLGADGWAASTRDGALYPEWTPEVMASSREELDRYLDAALWEADGSWHDVLTLPLTHVDARLAPIYGVDVPESGWERVDLDPRERAGVLTLSGFTSAHADALTSDPIHRGVWVVRRILCEDLPAPPPGIGEPPPPEPGQTNRERIEALTGDGTCGEGCHSTLINPAGFAFEHYDAIGAFRSTDAGRPVDASGVYGFDGVAVPFTDAVDFVALAASAEQTHACYASHWLEYLHGRVPVDLDATVVDALARRSLSDASVRDLVRQLVLDRSFTHREDR
jgi:hypothetical protein